MAPVRTRFAPSPTGFMHIGGVRTALFAWLYARQNNGQFILRIEDTDKAREVEGSIEHIVECLAWLGIDFDEGVGKGGPYGSYKQSERLSRYNEFAMRLIGKGLAYPDPYTVTQIEEFREKADKEKRPFLFREYRPEAFGTWDGKTALRFKVPEVKKYEWTDLVRGELSAGEEALDDFILIKADGYPTYNFAHIVDDYDMKITHIMRGEEFISSTPKFLSLYEALEIERPEIATMPVILGSEGTKKLGKRDGAKDLLEYRAEGILPEALVNFLALLGWHPRGDEEILSLADLKKEFTLERIQKGGAHLQEDKLLHINRAWMRKLDDATYIARGALEASDAERLLRAIPILKERAQTFKEAQEMIDGELSCLFTAPVVEKKPLVEKGGDTFLYLRELRKRLEECDEHVSVEGARERLMSYADSIPKEQGGRGAVLWPLRYALSGQERSPDPFTLIHILGTTESVLRLKKAESVA